MIAVLTGVLAGLLPALKASAPSLVADLRGDGPAARVAGRRWSLRDALALNADKVGSASLRLEVETHLGAVLLRQGRITPEFARQAYGSAGTLDQAC